MKRRILIIIILLVLSASLSGYVAWKDSRRARIYIDWSTASELDTAGFNIYRSDDISQGYVKINTQIIPASQEPLTGGEYSYLDDEVIPGRVYYYILEDITFSGQASQSAAIEIKALANYWFSLILAMIFTGLAIILMVNIRGLNNICVVRGKNSKGGVPL